MGNEFKGFDEEDCVNFINDTLSEELKEKYNGDDILYIVDLIWDYYEKKGLLSLSDVNDIDDEELLDEEDLVKFVRNELRKDSEWTKGDDADAIRMIVKGELKYEESLDDIF